MINVLIYLLIIISLTLQGCHYIEPDEKSDTKTLDRSKAAFYNVQLGLGYLKQGDRPRAKSKFLKALEQEPKSADVNAAIAYYFEQTHEYNEANKYYLKAIALSSNAGAQLNNYGAFLCRQKNYKLAEGYFLKAVNDMQYLHTSAAYENAGLCALEIPDFNKAKLYFTMALNQDPSRRESLNELAKLEKK